MKKTEYRALLYSGYGFIAFELVLTASGPKKPSNWNRKFQHFRLFSAIPYFWSISGTQGFRGYDFEDQ